VIVSNTITESLEDTYVCSGLSEAISKAQEFNRDIFFIGGSGIYAKALPLVDRLYISHVKKEYEGDTHFPAIDLKVDWEEEKVEPNVEFDLKIYRRK